MSTCPEISVNLSEKNVHPELNEKDDGVTVVGVESPSLEKAEIVHDHSAGKAVIDQRRAIPTSGKRIPTGKWEYILFILFYFNQNGAPIGVSAQALRQALLNLNFPDGYMTWGGSYLPVNTVLLDLSGIMFAVQLVSLLIVGPFADYGSWRPWILITSWGLMTACELGMIGLSTPSQWAIANGLWIVGNLASNVMSAFYQATFPNLVRDLPMLIESERQVRTGEKDPADHEQLDAYERSKLYNYCNIYGSASVVVWYGIGMGISYAVGFATTETLIRAYRILLGYYTPITMLCAIPYFIVAKHRPGQAIPANTPLWLVGFKQIRSAAKCARKLKYCLMYLAAYALLAECSGTAWSLIGIVQNEVTQFSPMINSAYQLLGDLSGGSGTVFILLLHRRYRWSVKNILFYGAIMTQVPILWGALGTFTHAIGYRHVWEFWVVQLWNFATGAWGSYNITMISEVAPASKLFLFYALFNVVSQTSGFVGPFIGAAIIERANGNYNVVMWFCLGLGIMGLVVLYFVDTDQAKLDCAEFLEQEARELYTEQQREESKMQNEVDEQELRKA